MPFVHGHEPLSRLLMPSGTDFVEWFNTTTGGLKRRLLIGAHLARVFRYLHLSGLAYCDLSPANTLIAKDPRVVSLCLIDSDNLSETVMADTLVLGTPRYMAPEILKGYARPDSLTDSFSLAVILFELLRLGHPLLGDDVLEGPPTGEEPALRGELPFVEHPTDDRNRSSTQLPSAVSCTKAIDRLFQRVFVDGLVSRLDRPTPLDWEEACLLAADHLSTCKECGSAFYPTALTPEARTTACAWCDTVQDIPPFLVFYDVAYAEGRYAQKKCDIASFVVSKSSKALVSRHAFSGLKGIAGDELVATVKMGKRKATVELENRSSDRLYIVSPPSVMPEPLAPSATCLIEPNTLVYFDIPQENRAVRVAKLVIRQG